VRRARLGLEAELDRAGRELVLSHPLVAQLRTGATLQLRAGASREKALRSMAQAAGVEEVGSFTTLLTQADKRDRASPPRCVSMRRRCARNAGWAPRRKRIASRC